MALAKKIIDFYDEMLDGEGVAKMMRIGERKGISPANIKIAAEEVYHQHIAGVEVTPLTAAHRVYRIAKHQIIKAIYDKEILLAQEKEELLRRIEELERKAMPFIDKLYLWWPDAIYFY